MEIFGYIIGSINLIVGYIIIYLRKVDDYLLDAESIIMREFLSAYKEFGNSIIGNVIEQFDNSIERLKRYYYSSIIDIIKIKKIDYYLKITLPIIILLIIITVISILIGLKYISENNLYLKFIFIICIPILLLIFELGIIMHVFKYEKYLKRIIIKYKNLNY